MSTSAVPLPGLADPELTSLVDCRGAGRDTELSSLLARCSGNAVGPSTSSPSWGGAGRARVLVADLPLHLL